MTNALKCTVIIPTHNRARLLGLTLNSLTRQSLSRHQFEVLVVDDGSTDDTAAMVGSFGERLNIRYLHLADEGFWVGKVRNLGITHAQADICVFIDSGVLAHSDLLTAHVSSHESADGPIAVCGYVYCYTLYDEDAATVNRAIDFENPDATMAILSERHHWLDIRERFYARYGDDFHDLPAPWLMFWTVNSSARTEQLRSVGMFDEAFRSWGGEDVDVGYRLHLDGARIVLCRKAGSIHIPHDKNFHDDMQILARNYQYMAQKYKTPIMRLLGSDPPLDFFEINEIIRERELPTCAEYLAQQRTMR